MFFIVLYSQYYINNTFITIFEKIHDDKFWVIAILIYVVAMFILVKLTLKDNRKETGKRIWRFGNGRSTAYFVQFWCNSCFTAYVALDRNSYGVK